MDASPLPLASKASRLDAAEANRIAAVYKVRTFPLPPGDLLGEEVYENDQRGTERLDEAAKRVVAPHWNTAVDLLSDGAEGYLALVRLRDRLAGRIAEIGHEADQGSIHLDIARSIRQILSHEAERYGSDAQIGDSLATRAEPADEDGWWWEPRRSYTQQQLPVAGAPPALFALRSTYLDGLIATYEWGLKHTLVEFEREWTWSRALNRATANVEQAEGAMRDRDDRAYDLVKFRLRVVEQVLMEYELLGRVDEFGVGGVRRAALDGDQAVFVQAALSAVHAVESEVEEGIIAAPTWDAVRKRIEDETGWGLTRIEGAATRLGAYERRAGSGRPTAAEIQDRYEQFRERIVALADSAGDEEPDESA